MNEINQILIDTLQVSEDQVKENLKMDDVDNWDSLSHMNLIVAIEERFSLELTGDEIADMTSFDAIREVIGKHIK